MVSFFKAGFSVKSLSRIMSYFSEEFAQCQVNGVRFPYVEIETCTSKTLPVTFRVSRTFSETNCSRHLGCPCATDRWRSCWWCEVGTRSVIRLTWIFGFNCRVVLKTRCRQRDCLLLSQFSNTHVEKGSRRVSCLKNVSEKQNCSRLEILVSQIVWSKSLDCFVRILLLFLRQCVNNEVYLLLS